MQQLHPDWVNLCKKNLISGTGRSLNGGSTAAFTVDDSNLGGRRGDCTVYFITLGKRTFKPAGCLANLEEERASGQHPSGQPQA